MRLVEREQAVLGLLKALSESTGNCVLVGGYAVSALAGHRFSVDCDLVVQERDIRSLDSVLRANGFSRAQERSGFDRKYAGRFLRYTRKIDHLPVSADLMVGSLVCRDTQGAWSFDYILSNSVLSLVGGLEGSVKFRTANRDLLLAFKLHSARRADVRDIVMLSEGANWDAVNTHFERGDPAKLGESLKRVLRALDDPKLAGSLRSEFSTSVDLKNRIKKTKDRARRLLSKLLPVLSQPVKGKIWTRQTRK